MRTLEAIPGLLEPGDEESGPNNTHLEIPLFPAFPRGFAHGCCHLMSSATAHHPIIILISFFFKVYHGYYYLMSSVGVGIPPHILLRSSRQKFTNFRLDWTLFYLVSPALIRMPQNRPRSLQYTCPESRRPLHLRRTITVSRPHHIVRSLTVHTLFSVHLSQLP